MPDYYTLAEISLHTGKAAQTIRAAMRGEGVSGPLPTIVVDGVKVVKKEDFHAFYWAERGRHGASRGYRYNEAFEKVYG